MVEDDRRWWKMKGRRYDMNQYESIRYIMMFCIVFFLERPCTGAQCFRQGFGDSSQASVGHSWWCQGVLVVASFMSCVLLKKYFLLIESQENVHERQYKDIHKQRHTVLTFLDTTNTSSMLNRRETFRKS